MACGLTNSNYPDYLSSILSDINAGNDDELKACACNLKSYVDVNSKPYALPICISSVNGEDNEIYTILNNYVISQGGYTVLQPIDPQRIMELQYKYKGFTENINGKGYPRGSTCTDEGPSVLSSNFSENIKLEKVVESRKHQVCNMFLFIGNTINNGYLADCDGPEEEKWNPFQSVVPRFGFHYYFFMDTYVAPECGEPGPVLYQFLYYYANYGYIPVNDYFFQVYQTPPSAEGYRANNTTNLIAW